MPNFDLADVFGAVHECLAHLRVYVESGNLVAAEGEHRSRRQSDIAETKNGNFHMHLSLDYGKPSERRAGGPFNDSAREHGQPSTGNPSAAGRRAPLGRLI